MTKKLDSKKLLTICVPTYNRKGCIKKRIHNYEALSRFEEVNILIADNFSTDGTFEYLKKTFRDLKNVSIIQHQKNIGAASNIVQFFDIVETEYLVLCSDEDEVIAENIETYLEFLASEKPHYIRGNFYELDGGLKRRCANRVAEHLSSKNIAINSTYASGLIFNTKSSKHYISFLKEKIKTSYYTRFFPHQELLYWLWSKHDKGFYYLCTPIVVKRDNVEINAISNDGKSQRGFREWESVSFRWKIFIDKQDALFEIGGDHSCQEKFRKIIDNHKKGIFHVLKTAVCRERPDILEMADSKLVIFHLSQAFIFLKKILRQKSKR